MFLAPIALIVVWSLDTQRQDKFLRSALVCFLGYVAFLLWMLFLSDWRVRRRATVLGITALVMVLCPLTLRIKGVTGDLLPIVEFRWAGGQHVAERAATPQAQAAALTNSYPQFLGPNRDGTLSGPALARDWKSSPPQELWRHAVGAAWSGFAVEGNRAITQEQRGEDELVVCYDVLTGAPLWTHADKARFATTIAGEGPRCTPTISSNRVFTMGARGVLNCLELTTGKLLWTHDTLAEFKAELPPWGVACSPLVHERAVFVTIGGAGAAMVAFDRETGAKLWASGSDSPHWCSPTRAVLHGTPQIVVFSENVSAYDEETGRVLWQSPWKSPFPHVTTPLVLSSNRVLVSQGYGGGAELLQIQHDGKNGWRAERVWKSIRLKSKFADLLQLDGFIYGLDDGAVVCLDSATGELKWKGDRYGHGQMILVNRLILLMAESGDIVLVEPDPKEFRELARHKVFSSKTWNPPALAGDILLLRNDAEAACLRLAVSK
jgi:outer membrane protein assembly factor BamB